MWGQGNKKGRSLIWLYPPDRMRPLKNVHFYMEKSCPIGIAPSRFPPKAFRHTHFNCNRLESIMNSHRSNLRKFKFKNLTGKTPVESFPELPQLTVVPGRLLKISEDPSFFQRFIAWKDGESCIIAFNGIWTTGDAANTHACAKKQRSAMIHGFEKIVEERIRKAQKGAISKICPVPANPWHFRMVVLSRKNCAWPTKY